MAESIMSGLFGMTPESYQDTRQRLEQAQALQQAQLDPYEAVNYMAARAGQQLGRGLGGLLGGQDPTLQRISAFQNLASQADLFTPEGYINFGKQLMSVDPQKGALAIQRGQQMAREQAESSAIVTLREAQAKKAREYQMATTSSERNRKLISEADVTLKEGRPLSATQESELRYQVSQELKPKVFRDATTGEVITIDPLNISLAAPNVAKFLKLAETTGTAGGVSTIPTSQSQELQVSQAEALKELTNRTKDLRTVIQESRDLIGNRTTGYGAILSILPETDARTLSNNIETIKSNLAFAQLNALKEASKSGASGLGAVTIKEFESLQSSIAKLDPYSKNFKNDLERIDKTYARLLDQLEGKTTRAEERVKATQPKKPEVPGLLPSDVAPQKSRFSGLNPELKAEESPMSGQTKKGTKYQIMQ
jgi:hypothetical protein